MYQYFNGLVIREGTDGVPAEYGEALFEDAGWARNTPEWQKESFPLYSEIQPRLLQFGIITK